LKSNILYRHVSVAVITAALGSALPAVAATYTITALPGGSACAPLYINDTSTIVGACNGTAVVWTASGPSSLGRLAGGTFSQANAVNNLGVAVGDGDTGNSRPQAWVQTAAGLYNFFPNNGGNTHAVFIGDNGYIGGYYTKSLSGNASSWHGSIWTPDPKDPRKYVQKDLPILPGGVNSKLSNAIPSMFNQLGQAVGYGQTDQLTGQHAVFWNNDAKHSIVDLGTLPGDLSSLAWDLNDLGQAVGESDPPFGRIPTLWNNDAAHTPVALPFPAGDNFGTANSINSIGQVLGSTAYATPGTWNTTGSHIVIWRDGGVFDLTSLLDPATGAGWTITYAPSINNKGQIVGIGELNGTPTPFLMTPQ
jgi:uncharacterized membrane protein